MSPIRPTAGLAGCEVCGEVSDLWGYAVECGTLVKPPSGGMAKTKLGTPMGNLVEAENPDCEVRNPRPYDLQLNNPVSILGNRTGLKT